MERLLSLLALPTGPVAREEGSPEQGWLSEGVEVPGEEPST